MKKNPKQKLKVFQLGGLGEIGKNMSVLEYGNDIIVIDCGLGFPDDAMLGIDLVIPDVSYLVKNIEKVRGIFLTHGHEDHIGAVPYVLNLLPVPVYGTRLTLGILQNKLLEHTLTKKADLRCVDAGEIVKTGVFSIEFIRVNHSIADAVCLAIKTPCGTVVHSGDFKIDLTPVEGETVNLTRLGEIGKEGVTLLMCESTNAEHEGYTPSEKVVGASLDRYFEQFAKKRIIIATFSSNVHRVQQIIDLSVKHKRKVAITGRSMINIIGAACELGYMNMPQDILIDISEVKKFSPHQVTIVSTGSQGEPMSALYRMAFSMHDKIELSSGDVVIISASAIPGNEKLIGNIINELYHKGVNVLYEAVAGVHVSGHACQEELKLFHALIKPKYFMPIHGEYRHLVMHSNLAQNMGMSPKNIFVTEVGKVLEIDEKSAKINSTVPSGKIMVDGSGVGDVGSIVLRDRKHLAEDGIIVVVASVDTQYKLLIKGPEVVSRGFVYVKEAEELMEEVREVCETVINNCLDNHYVDWNIIKNKIKDELSKFISAKTKRKPMILPIILEE